MSALPISSLKTSAVHDTWHLCGMDSLAGVQYPCVWYRGLMPQSLLAVHTPFEAELRLEVLGAYPGRVWPSGRYYTDGSGGKHSAAPALRRCGFGVAYMTEARGRSDFAWGVFGPLIGKVQTVPRAELFACVTVLARVSCAPVLIVTDSKLVYDAWSGGELKCTGAANADLWGEFWQHARRIGVSDVRFQWIKAHATPLIVQHCLVSLGDLRGNACADALADRAAEQWQIFPQDAQNVFWHMAVLQQIQKRCVSILIHVAGSAQEGRERRHRTVRLPRLPATGAAIGSDHALLLLGNMWRCAFCQVARRASASDLREWFASECTPFSMVSYSLRMGEVRPTEVPYGYPIRSGKHVLHESHASVTYKGLIFCRRCGCYSTGAPKLLKAQCAGVPNGSTRARLWRLRRGLLPHAMQQWPNEAADCDSVFVQL